MEQVKQIHMNKVIDLFRDWNETLIWSCIQGYMGEAYVDNLERPKTACIIVGVFCFLAGRPNTKVVRELFKRCDLDYLLVIPKDDQWYPLIEEMYTNKYDKFMRYAIKKENDVFDEMLLQRYIKNLSSEFTIRKIDEQLFYQTREEAWSSDLCSQFEEYSTYATYGIGYVVMDGDVIVSGASSYTVYDKGIEIEIDTREDYRRQGLALACAAKLILECLDRGLYPSWDAANKASVALSEKLGYHFDKEYVTYGIMRY